MVAMLARRDDSIRPGAMPGTCRKASGAPTFPIVSVSAPGRELNQFLKKRAKPVREDPRKTRGERSQ